MIAIKHFRECIVRPALDQLQLYSLAAEELLVITCAQESLGGTYLMQNDARGYPKGPALGPYEMERPTYYDLFYNFLNYRPMLWERLVGPTLYVPDAERMVYDLRYATGVARLNYYRFPKPLPDYADIDALVRYYKKYWNTELGAATLKETRENYEKFAANY